MSYKSGGSNPFQVAHLSGASSLALWVPAGIIGGTGVTTGSPAIGTLFALPFMCFRGGTLDRLAFEVTTVGGAGSKGRAGIYDSVGGGNLFPNNLVVDGGEFDTAAAGGVGVKAATISTILKPDRLYWLAYLCGVAAPTVRAAAVASLFPILGFDGTALSTLRYGFANAQAYGALPATYPAGTTYITAVPIPVLAARFSA